MKSPPTDEIILPDWIVFPDGTARELGPWLVIPDLMKSSGVVREPIQPVVKSDETAAKRREWREVLAEIQHEHGNCLAVGLDCHL